jgi:tape measure domain-containing protein
MAGFSGSLGSLWIEIGARIDNLQSKLREASAEIKGIVDKAKNDISMLDLGKGFALVGGAVTAALAPLGLWTKASVEAAASMDSLKRGLTAITKDAGETEKQLGRLEQIARLPGLGLKEAVQGSINLQAVGVSAAEAERMLKATGNALAAVGKGKTDLSAVVTQLVQMSTKSKVVAGDLKPIMERIPQVADIVKKAFGTIDTEVLQKNKVSTQDFIQTVITGLEAIPPQTGGVANAFENIGDTIEKLKVKFGNVLLPLIERLAPVVEGALVKLGELVDWFSNLPEPIKIAAGAFVALFAAFATLTTVVGGAMTLWASFTALFSGGGLLAGLGVTAAGFVSLAGAIPLVLAALTAIGVWVYKNWDAIVAVLAQAWSGIQEAWEAVWGPIRDWIIGVWQTIATNVTGVWNSISSATAGIWGPIVKFFLGIWDGVASVFTSAWNGIASVLNAVWNGIKSVAATVWGAITGAIATFLEAASKIPGVNKLINLDQAWASAKKASEELKKTAAATTDMGNAAKGATGPISEQEKRSKALADQVEKLKQKYDIAGMAAGESGKATEEHGKKSEDAEKKMRPLEKRVASLDAMARELGQQYAKTGEDLAEFALAHQDAASKVPKLIDVTDELSQSIQSMVSQAKLTAPAFIDAGKEATEAMRAPLEAAQKLEAAFKRAGIVSTDALEQQRIQAVEDYSIILESGKATAEQLDILWDRALGKTEDAYKRLGITSKATLDKQVEEARTAYEEIRASGDPSELDRAWVAYEEKRIAAARAAGEKIPDEQIKALEKMKDQLGKSHDDQKGMWDTFSKQVSTIISDAAKGIVDRFAKLSDFNDQLDEQAAKLKESLAERQADYDEFALGIAASLEEAHAAYAETLAEEEESLRASLEERKKDYDEFAEEVGKSLAELREKHEKAAAKERDEILDGLDDRTEDYEDYQGDIEKRIDKLRKDHSDSAQKEVAALQKSLAEKRKDYDRYVEDVNVKLQRIRAKNKGIYSEEEADLLTSLKRRTEDFQQYERENAEAQTEVQNKHRTQLAEQEQELRDSLAKKTRDYEEYKSDVAEKLEGVTLKHKEQVEKEEADLLASLDKKKKDYEDYVTEASSKFEKIRTEALDKLTKQEADLKEKLANQTKEWDAYKEDVKLKLQEIEDKHLGIFGKIAEVGKGIFTDIGAAIGRFVTEELVGKLFKELKNLADDILPSVGRSLAGVFGKSADSIADAAGKAEGAADKIGGAQVPGGGGGGGGAAAAGSGLAGIVSAVGSIGTMISSIVGNFQMAKQETSLNAIEHNTRYSMMYLGERSDGGILGVLFRISEYLQWVQPTLENIENKTYGKLSEIFTKAENISTRMDTAVTRLLEVSTNTQWGSKAEQDNGWKLEAMLTELRTLNGKQQVVNVYINGALASSTSTSGTDLKMQGVLAI